MKQKHLRNDRLLYSPEYAEADQAKRSTRRRSKENNKIKIRGIKGRKRKKMSARIRKQRRDRRHELEQID